MSEPKDKFIVTYDKIHLEAPDVLVTFKYGGQRYRLVTEEDYENLLKAKKLRQVEYREPSKEDAQAEAQLGLPKVIFSVQVKAKVRPNIKAGFNAIINQLEDEIDDIRKNVAGLGTVSNLIHRLKEQVEKL